MIHSEKRKEESKDVRPLLLAPAGNRECLTAALQAGADAIYFGIDQLNMRAGSVDAFTIDDLPDVATQCHSNSAKAYLALNTILYDHDLSYMKRIMDAAKIAGIDAVICADVAAMQYARRIELPVHISTQCNITNVDTVEFYAAFAEVMVLSRELTLQQLQEIIRQIKGRNITSPDGRPIQIEVFAHGALCMAVSGKCHLSLHSHNASANRGACVQNCRREYLVIDKESGNELNVDGEYIFSAKDLCTLPFLDKLIHAGVSVLKIEGRSRSADYVYKTTRCYREAIDAIAEGGFTSEKIKAWMSELDSVFNRGFWEGYYLGKEIGEWSKSDGSVATQRKVYLGKGRKYYPKIGIGEFIIESHALRENDQIMITGPSTGYMETIVKDLHIEGQPGSEAKKGKLVTFRVPLRIRPSDKLYKLVSQNG